jgi:hypothetical protein
MVRRRNPVHYWAEEKNELNIRQDAGELFSAVGGNFWRSVWKRIESSESRDERSTQVREKTLEPPRDYAV